jgi:hypothetical protein
MKKRFIVGLDHSTTEQDTAFREYLRASGLNWWHWISDMWLLVDPYGQFSASQLRDKLNEIYPTVRNIVIEIRSDGDTWSGYGPKSEDKNMFTWIRGKWKND